MRRSVFDEISPEELRKEQERAALEYQRQHYEVKQLLAWATEHGEAWFSSMLASILATRGEKGLQYLLKAIFPNAPETQWQWLNTAKSSKPLASTKR